MDESEFDQSFEDILNDDGVFPGVSDESAEISQEPAQLGPAQRARIERNRQRALMIRHERMKSQPYHKKKTNDVSEGLVYRVQGSKLIDTGGGFLIDENDLAEQAQSQPKITSLPAPILEPDQPSCIECKENFDDSFLFRTFDHSVCDKCHDKEEKHTLITKSDAKEEFLLKDCDFDRREPALKFLSRKNPHNSRWGDMKLFLRLQVEKRAMEVWGSEEMLEEEHERREEKRVKSKVKKYDKQVKALRMSMRSSMYTKNISSHVHEYGPESYNEDEDTYSQTCQECGHVNTYEKM